MVGMTSRIWIKKEEEKGGTDREDNMRELFLEQKSPWGEARKRCMPRWWWWFRWVDETKVNGWSVTENALRSEKGIQKTDAGYQEGELSDVSWTTSQSLGERKKCRSIKYKGQRDSQTMALVGRGQEHPSTRNNKRGANIGRGIRTR